MARNLSKYKNKKTITGFDSKLEEKFSEMLDAANIVYEKQSVFILQQAYTNNRGDKIRAITYISDFYFPNLQIVIDIKGMKTEIFKIKKKLFEFKYPELNLYLLTKCPKKYLPFNDDALFPGWIEKDKLAKLQNKNRSKRKKEKNEEKIATN